MPARLLINVNNPNVPDVPDIPVNPDEPVDTEPIVIPDTGGNTILDTGNSSNGGASMVLPMVGAMVLAVVVVTTVVAMVVRRRKDNKFLINTSRRLATKLASLSVVSLLGLFAIIGLNRDFGLVNAQVYDDNLNDEDADVLSITTNDITIDLNLENDKVYGMGESVVSIDSATTAGYTLMAYVDSASSVLKNETDASSASVISMLKSTYSQALIDNTWGIATTKPNSEEDMLFRGLPTTEKEIMTLKTINEATEAGDESTFYFGTYVTPDLDYGTYGGVTINYVALANVDSDVVTVKYFSYEGDLISTASYGVNSRIAYLSDGCSTEYLGETQTVKTNNLGNDGEMIDTYKASENYEDFQYVTFEGADYLRVKLTYGFRYGSSVAIFGGSSPDEDNFVDYFESYYTWQDRGETTTVNYIVESDTVGFGTANAWTRNYGYYAKITPVYMVRPSDVETTEYENCHIAKSDNIDEFGNKVGAFEGFDSGSMNTISPIYIPGANRLIIDAKYDFLNNNADFVVSKGITHNHNNVSYCFVNYGHFPDEGSFRLNGNKATITVQLEGDVEDFSEAYGYYAQAHPIFYEEHENSAPVLIYDAYRKSGSYDSSRFYEWEYYQDELFYVYDRFFNEEAVIEYIENNFETLRGKTINLSEVQYTI